MNYIDIIKFEPGRTEPIFKTIKNELKPFQKEVGGYIETIPLPGFKNHIMIVNEEGLLKHLPKQVVADWCLYGNVVIVGTKEAEFISPSNACLIAAKAGAFKHEQ